jgi:hypothetical protein
MSKDDNDSSKEKPTGKEKPTAKEKPNVDEAVEFYSKRWGVSKEEAAGKIQKLLEERKAPSMEDMFPEPLGEVSKKLMDINQAVLNTALTRKKVAELESPQKSSGVAQDIDEAVHEAGRDIIKGKLTATDPIRQKLDDALGDFFSDVLKDRLKSSKPEDLKTMLDGLFDEFGEKVIKPLYQDVEALKKEKGTEPTVSETADLVMAAEEKYRQFLEKRGYKVESVSITRDSVEKMIHDAVTAEKEKWEQDSGATVQVETERIKATENILTGVMDRVFDVFLTPIKDKIQEAIEKGAFKPAPAGP